MNVRRWPLGDLRELRAVRSHGRIILTTHDIGSNGPSRSGPFAFLDGDLDTVRSALADLAGETGASEATEAG